MKIKIRRLDVWGNEDSGYEVNDILWSREVIEPEYQFTMSDEDWLKYLDNELDLVYADKCIIEDHTDSLIVCDKASDMPLFEIYSLDHD